MELYCTVLYCTVLYCTVLYYNCQDDTVELVDDSELLGEEDLVKPDPASLRVCGTTGRRKACK